VTTTDGETVKCKTYRGRWAGGGKPSPQYLDVMIRGAKQNSVPKEYLTYLENIPHNNNKKTVYVYERIIESLK